MEKSYESGINPEAEFDDESPINLIKTSFDPIQLPYRHMIEEAIKIGAEREPLEHDVLIHPEFPFQYSPYLSDRGYPEEIHQRYPEIIHNYRDRIANIIQQNREAIICLFGGEQNIYADRFRRPLLFNYQGHPTMVSQLHEGSRLVSGRIRDLDLETFLTATKGINPQDHYRIHGADFADCIPDFAEQIYALLNFGQFHPAWRNDDERKKADHCREVITEMGLIRESSIRAGVTFDSRNTFTVCRESEPNAIPMQLIDEHSVTMPSQVI